jgi:hypothetical protein
MDQKVANVNIANVTPSLETVCDIVLLDVKLPKKVKYSGRPKGAAQTSIGLPKKRAISKSTAFAQKNFKIKVNVIMEWLTKKKWSIKLEKTNI